MRLNGTYCYSKCATCGSECYTFDKKTKELNYYKMGCHYGYWKKGIFLQRRNKLILDLVPFPKPKEEGGDFQQIQKKVKKFIVLVKLA